MAKDITIQQLVDETKRLNERFRELEARPWTIETFVAELLAETGTLADFVMIKEGYRPPRPNQSIDFEDAISDVLFVLLSIADHYGVSVEEAYISMLRGAHDKLDQR